jgi:hypothetical protein
LSLRFSHFQLESILGYPHAGNDVFYVGGVYEGRPCRAFLKVERQTGADVENEIRTIQTLPFSLKPEILAFHFSNRNIFLLRKRKESAFR